MSHPGVAPSGHILTSNGITYQYTVLSGDVAGIAHDTKLRRLMGASVVDATPQNGLFLGYDGSNFTLLPASGSSGAQSTIFPTGLIIGLPTTSGVRLASDLNSKLLITSADDVNPAGIDVNISGTYEFGPNLAIARSGTYGGLSVFSIIDSTRPGKGIAIGLPSASFIGQHNSNRQITISNSAFDFSRTDGQSQFTLQNESIIFNGGGGGASAGNINNPYLSDNLATFLFSSHRNIGGEVKRGGIILGSGMSINWTNTLEVNWLAKDYDVTLGRSGVAILAISNPITFGPASGLVGGIIWDGDNTDGVLLKRSAPTTLRIRNGNDTADGHLIVNNLTVNGTHNITGGSASIAMNLVWMGW